ncbi:hypothetical protein [Methyloceanibacter sp.]|uniref:hypothetical protein n=1 Tax=Methyloceanibacter sp. TaxID=1965321 RepID=UPI002C1999C9|nr:hypothetical protein [Methyloceanibacter sp.]HML91691.1 hypothetical protein [Methyloceanibacter sp.]
MRAALLSGLALVLLVFSCSGSLAAESRNCPYTPAPETAERKAIVDALRKPVTKDLGQSVIFVISDLNVCGDWAFVAAEPKRKNGTPVDWSLGSYADDMANDVCGGLVHALLVKRGGTWTVRELAVCATDVPWIPWADDFGAPPALFPEL